MKRTKRNQILNCISNNNSIVGTPKFNTLSAKDKKNFQQLMVEYRVSSGILFSNKIIIVGGKKKKYFKK